MLQPQLKILISGGGTGGHIFPAIAIADAIRRKFGNANILFVGAKGRMEMEKVPFIMLTAQADKGKVIHAIKSGASGYIIKPMTKQMLKDRIDKLLQPYLESLKD